jgi:putative transcriptional regulator
LFKKYSTIKKKDAHMIEPAPGVLLIAEPFLKDPNFMRTVVALCMHNEEGSLGFVINRKEEYTLNELMKDTDDLPLPVFYGGPVQLDTIHFLHQCPEEIPDSQQIAPNIYWGGNYEVAIARLREGKIDASQIRFFIGHSGWGSGQLREELSQHSWLTVSANCELLFKKNEKEIWKEAVRQLGGEYEQLVNYPTDPQLN